jgi:hypothetical protein
MARALAVEELINLVSTVLLLFQSLGDASSFYYYVIAYSLFFCEPIELISTSKVVVDRMEAI